LDATSHSSLSKYFVLYLIVELPVVKERRGGLRKRRDAMFTTGNPILNKILQFTSIHL
jgi:hypothetical protein